MSYGLLEKPFSPTDDHFKGASRSADEEPINPSGQWQEWLPNKEYQFGNGFDTMACVSFSALNVIEIISRYKFSERTNYSDRFLAKVSGTTDRGNYLSDVADAIRNVGLVTEERWPYTGKSWSDYYKTIPVGIMEEATQFKNKWEVKYDWVQKRDFKEALKYAPIQTTVYAWNGMKQDIYLDPKKDRNHAVTLVGYEDGKCWKIFDHYEPDVKRLEWDYDFGVGLKFSLNLKTMATNIVNNTLVQDVEGTGAFGLFLDNKIFVGDEGQIALTFFMRNNGNIVNRCTPIKKELWSQFPKYTFKGEKL
jgi:hypothetical protein